MASDAPPPAELPAQSSGQQYQAYRPPPESQPAQPNQTPLFVPPPLQVHPPQAPQQNAPPGYAPPSTGQAEQTPQQVQAPPSVQDEKAHQQNTPLAGQAEQLVQQPHAPPASQNEQAQQQFYPPPPPAGHHGLYHPPPSGQETGTITSQQAPAQEQSPPPEYKTYDPAAYAAPSASPKPDVHAPGPSAPAAAPAAGYYGDEKVDHSQAPIPPPRRNPANFGDDDPSNPIHYTRDPHKLVAYLVPFPKPKMKNVDTSKIPERFLIYTPPPPPLSKPKEGEKEGRFQKVQRKWQEEVREAKTSTAKTASWKGIKGKATKGIDWAMSKTTSSSLDFLNRIEHDPKKQKKVGGGGTHSDDEVDEAETTKRTLGLEEMVLVHPASVPGTQEQLRAEFVNSMLRTKSKAQRDSVIATGLLPVGFAIDVLATLVWPFGGLAEIDSVWLYASLRGAKVARTTTKRLTSSSASGKPDDEQDKLRLTFAPSQRLEVLRAYLAARCHEREPYIFPAAGPAPTESQVLEAIGWAPAQTGGETKNWEDEQWETSEVKDDLKAVMGKGAREWEKWCKAFEKDPEKALKK